MNTNYLKIGSFFRLNGFTPKFVVGKSQIISKNFFKQKSVRFIFSCILLVAAIVPAQLYAQSTTTVFDTAGTTTWTAPAGITSITVQVWGAGGGGASTGAANGSGGGGGGAYSTSIIAVTPGTTYTLQVGAGGAGGTGCAVPTDGAAGTNSWFISPTTLFANAGTGGKIPIGTAGGIGGIGGAAQVGAGITSYKGGDGAVGGQSIVFSPGGGGGGGSSAGTGANGVNGDGPLAAAAQTLGGAGGIAPPGGGYGGQGGGYNNVNGLLNGVDGAAPGGGGGGAGNGSNPSCIGLNTDGGNGGHGRIIITTGQTIFTQTGSWTAPSCISSVIVEAWGGGGGGGGNDSTQNGAGGGGGGAYSKSIIPVTPGQTYAVTVGTGGAGVAGAAGINGGDSWFINATTILAKGGTGGNPPIAGAGGIAGLGGLASAGVGTTKFSGGDGGPGNNAAIGFGGGGGSSAGYAANGTIGGDANALATVIFPAPGGKAPNGGGDGGDGQNTLLSGIGYSGFTPGGGGGGSSDIEVAPGMAGGQGANGRVILSYPNPSLVLGDNVVAAADVCANITNAPIHGFTFTGSNGCSTETDIRFTTTGTYTASEILNFKLYYTTTNVFSTANFLVAISSSTGPGTHSFPSISRPNGGITYYYWITMDVAPIVVDGHTIAVNGTTLADITSSPAATGSAAPSGTQTLKSAPMLSSTLVPASICSGSTFTYTPTSVTSPATFSWTRATIAGITEAGTSGNGNVNETLTNTSPNPIDVIYSYVTTSGITNCSSAGHTDSVIVTVNPNPQGSVKGNSRCGADPSSFGKLTWVETAGTGPYTLVYSPGSVSESGVVSGTSFSVNPNPAVTTTYTVTSVTDANGCVSTSNFTRDTATIIVTADPIVITTQPKDTTVCSRANASFTVSGTGIYSYSWEVSTDNGGNWTDVNVAAAPQPTYSNATTATLDLSSTDTLHNGYVYRAILSPACGAVTTTSGTATLTINALPKLSNTSNTATICSGNIFTYTPTSTAGSPTFSWSRATVTNIAEPASTGTSNISEALTNTSTSTIDVPYTIVTTASGCNDPAGEDVIVTVAPSPVLNSSLTPAAICSGDIFIYSPSSSAIDSAFTWTRATLPGITEPGTSGTDTINEILTNTTSTPIDVQYHYVTTSANCSVGGAGDIVTVTVNPNGVLTLTSAVGTDSQSVCINTPITTITYTVGGSGINAAATGLPAGVAGNFSTGVLTITGTPNISGVFNYTVISSGACRQDTITGTLVVGISLISTIGSDDQNVCINTPIVNIDYAIGGAGQGAVAAGLPAGVSGNFAAGVFTISGTPTKAGGFTYTVSTTGPCAVSSITGKITVGLSLISAIGTDSQSICLNSPIALISYKIVNGDVPPPSVIGLPPGVTGIVSNPGIYTISGTPTVEGLFIYTITANGSCGTGAASVTGQILVSIGKVSAIGTDSQKVCKNVAITNIVYRVVGGSTPPPSITGLPPGVTGTPGLGIFTISGTPTKEGTFTYTISAQGTCASPAKLTGRIIVGIGLISAIGSDSQKVCVNAPIAPIRYAVVGGDTPPPTVVGLPAGFTGAITSPGVFTITGAATVAKQITYTITTHGTCGAQSSIAGKITVGIGLISPVGTDNQTVCRNVAIARIVYSVVEGGTVKVTGLPTGWVPVVTAGNPGTVVISGTPTKGGTYTYTVSTTGGLCPSTSTTGVITVQEGTITSTTPETKSQTICHNAEIANVSYAIGGTANDFQITPALPSGINTKFIAGVLTISGQPSEQLPANTYTYTITTTGATCPLAQNSETFTLIILDPIADFSADSTIGVSPLLVTFTNESLNASVYDWSLGDTYGSNFKNPSNTYNTPGTYTVVLTASESTCSDTASVIITIEDNFTVTVPTIFTPNGDNVNDFFSVIVKEVAVLDVEIYDRWGLKLAEWHSPSGSWNGRSAKNDALCTDGTYYYMVYAKGNNGTEARKKGYFTLIR